MRNLKRAVMVLFLLLVVLLVLFFVLENQQVVTLVLFGWSTPSLPVAVILLAALILGLVVGPCLSLLSRSRYKRR